MTFIPGSKELSAYRKPELVWQSATNVAPLTIDGTGTRAILFPDGDYRTETNGTHYEFVITRNAVLSGSAQSGLRSSLSETNNQWYALYAVKVQDNANDWVLVGDFVTPRVVNITTLNTNFGVNSWVYLGMIRNGDNAGLPGDILDFQQQGNFTVFTNFAQPTSSNGLQGTVLATSTSVANLQWTYATGTGPAEVPHHITVGEIGGEANMSANTSAVFRTTTGGEELVGMQMNSAGGRTRSRFITNLRKGVRLDDGVSNAKHIWLTAFWDHALGVGANPVAY